MHLHDFDAVLAADLLRQFIPVVSAPVPCRRSCAICRCAPVCPTVGQGAWYGRRAAGMRQGRACRWAATPWISSRRRARSSLAEVLTLSGPVEAGGLVQLEGRQYAGGMCWSAAISAWMPSWSRRCHWLRSPGLGAIGSNSRASSRLWFSCADHPAANRSASDCRIISSLIPYRSKTTMSEPTSKNMNV